MTFEWDTNKNSINKKKHGIAFDEAVMVFKDPNLLVSIVVFENEERWNAIGFVGKLLFVVYTERDNDTIRIISARKATRKEQNEYIKNGFRRGDKLTSIIGIKNKRDWKF